MAGADIERLVVNMHTMGDIWVATKKEGVTYANPDYPVEEFWRRADGIPMPYMVDSRNMVGFTGGAPLSRNEQEQMYESTVETFCDLLDEVEALDQTTPYYDHLMGVPQAATVIAAMVGFNRGDSVLWSRVTKRHGPGSIYGRFTEGETVALIDHTLLLNNATFQEIEKLRKVGLHATAVAAFIDPEEGNREKLLQQHPNLAIVTALTMSQVVEILTDNRLITAEQLEWIDQYRERVAETGRLAPRAGENA